MPLHHMHHHHGRRDAQGHDHDHRIAADDNDPVATLISVIVVTQSADFAGNIGSWSTLGSGPVHTTAAAAISSALQSSIAPPSSAPAPVSTPKSSPRPATTTDKPTVTSNTKPSSTTLLTSIQTSADSSIDANTSDVFTSASVTSSAPPASATSATPANADPTSLQQSSGTSAGAKAGIAIGVLLGIAALAAVAYAFIRWKKNKNEELERTENEKNPFSDNAVASAPVAAPSTTQPPPPSQMQTRHDAPSATGGVALGAMAGGAAAGRIREVSQANTRSDHPSNPFGHQAELASENRFDVPAPLRPGTGASSNSNNGMALAGAGALATAAATNNLKGPQGLGIHRPNTGSIGTMPSPAPSEYSMTSMSATSAAAVAANAGHAPPVHRVQLDFKPSMDDEIHLKAGQLVRLLHEYDDGWALVIRMDRSQQGVAPRTCLSTRPVKPRNPNQGPSNNNTNNGSPQKQVRLPIQRPETPKEGTVVSSSSSVELDTQKQSAPVSPLEPRAPGKMPAAQPPRSMSPGPYGGGPQPAKNSPYMSNDRMRSNSAGNLAERRQAPGPSPMNPSVAATASSGALPLPPVFAAPVEVPGSPVSAQSISDMSIHSAAPAPLNPPTATAVPAAPASQQAPKKTTVARKPVGAGPKPFELAA